MELPLQFDLGNPNALILQQGALDLIQAVSTGETALFQGVDGVFESSKFKVTGVQIGTAVFTDVEVWLDAPRTSDSLDTEKFVLGGRDFGPWRFEVWDITLPGFDGFIGHDFLAKEVVCIDFPGNRLAIGR